MNRPDQFADRCETAITAAAAGIQDVTRALRPQASNASARGSLDGAINLLQRAITAAYEARDSLVEAG